MYFKKSLNIGLWKACYPLYSFKMMNSTASLSSGNNADNNDGQANQNFANIDVIALADDNGPVRR